MSAPTVEAPNLVWPPINGSVAPVDNSPTQAITVPGLRTEAFVPAQPQATDLAVGELSLGERMAAAKLEILATQNYDGVGMHDLGIANGRSGDNQNYERLDVAEPGRRAAQTSTGSTRNLFEHVAKPAAEPAAGVDEAEAVDRGLFLSRLQGLRSTAGAMATEGTVELPGIRPRRGGSAAAASFTHPTPARARFMAVGESLNSPYVRRRMPEQATETKASTVEIGEPQQVAPQVPRTGASRTERTYVPSHRMRSEGLLMKFLHRLPIPGWGRGRHIR